MKQNSRLRGQNVRRRKKVGESRKFLREKTWGRHPCNELCYAQWPGEGTALKN